MRLMTLPLVGTLFAGLGFVQPLRRHIAAILVKGQLACVGGKLNLRVDFF